MEKSADIIMDVRRHIKEFKERKDVPFQYKLAKVAIVLIESIRYYYGYIQMICVLFTFYILIGEKFKILFIIGGLILCIDKISRDWVAVARYLKDEEDEKKGIMKRAAWPKLKI